MGLRKKMECDDVKPLILHYQRRPSVSCSRSIETIFETLRANIGSSWLIKVRVAPFFSKGMVRRLGIVIDAWLHQICLMHITGDIHFACLLLSRSKVILTIHDLVFLCRAFGIRRFLFRLFWLTLPIKRAIIVTTVSKAVKDEILQTVGHLSPDIRVIHNAISDNFRPKRNPFNTGNPRLLQVGTAWNKNVLRLISSLEGLKCVLVIIGKIGNAINRSLKEHSLRFETYVNLSDDEMLEQYHTCDLVTFISMYEGFGLPVIESQAIGRPVVASDIPVMHEVAGEAALFVNPYDLLSIRRGIVSVISDYQLRENLIAKGFVNSKRFNQAKMVTEYRKVYEEIVFSSQHGRS